MFIKNIKQYDFINEKEIIGCNDFLWKTFHSVKKAVDESEYEDLKQDIILIVLQADRDYDEKAGASFLTFINHRMRAIYNDLLSKYTGIKINNKTKYNYEKRTGEKIYINKVLYKE